MVHTDLVQVGRARCQERAQSTLGRFAARSRSHQHWEHAKSTAGRGEKHVARMRIWQYLDVFGLVQLAPVLVMIRLEICN